MPIKHPEIKFNKAKIKLIRWPQSKWPLKTQQILHQYPLALVLLKLMHITHTASQRKYYTTSFKLVKQITTRKKFMSMYL